jgi:hypothetical protein
VGWVCFGSLQDLWTSCGIRPLYSSKEEFSVLEFHLYWWFCTWQCIKSVQSSYYQFLRYMKWLLL